MSRAGFTQGGSSYWSYVEGGGGGSWLPMRIGGDRLKEKIGGED